MEENIHIKRIQDKLLQLLRQYQVLQKENRDLQQELSNTQHQLSQQTTEIAALQQKVAILKMSSSAPDDAAKKDFEKRINQYLREIDRCIALLNE
jgi:pantothenate kinase